MGIYGSAGLVVWYASGTIRFYVAKGNAGNPMGFLQAISICVLPYLVPDAVRQLPADQIAVRAQKVLKR